MKIVFHHLLTIHFRDTQKTQSKARHLPGNQMINVTKVDEFWYDSSYSLILYVCTHKICMYVYMDNYT